MAAVGLEVSSSNPSVNTLTRFSTQVSIDITKQAVIDRVTAAINDYHIASTDAERERALQFIEPSIIENLKNQDLSEEEIVDWLSDRVEKMKKELEQESKEQQTAQAKSQGVVADKPNSK
ncbi:MAG: hypothetical protein A2600_11540 [Candidatus Lambdaproteobacteria bacterium RIFOXYD1_FULL_56_27]|uniref:Uncharacterized protein n=1 Tax=Candidatus Lambdaproteobacteria bacterium RIFOXYD2_FULL_56_26 TaxID=1817773 RepID=A0A1F6H0T3_9PROT|nr:MAG: hypothetical protein A2426_01230 [Candidatus Lambdaproteobacteria bacterium RIFOXYC1_FULL_56_13]OGH04003.1 MAG: hypothetical protein A2557_11300 [Candidatus Lambdaproteobacteria bacterium RIFOXYD2_FULL_56_26]OGH08394.1 MAG: hypothetical protein A2600_11540 [Candidatus Lambdaproteobacteria bacterium RIFOXYD1_FULL_56_27]